MTMPLRMVQARAKRLPNNHVLRQCAQSRQQQAAVQGQ
jgi:hypothetical protein